MKSSVLRRKLGITRADWARALSVNERTVQRWEEDDVDPGGLASEVMRGISTSLDSGADAKHVGSLVALGIGSLLFNSLVVIAALRKTQ